MSVTNFLKEKKYHVQQINNEYIYLFDVNTKFDFNTDTNNLNGVCTSINGIANTIYVNSLEYTSECAISNRFYFTNKLTITLIDNDIKPNNDIINFIMSDKWYVGFTNIENKTFILSCEHNADITYNNDIAKGILTITFTTLSNVPQILFDGELNKIDVRTPICSYINNNVKKLELVETNNVTIDLDDYNIDINGTLKNIEFNNNTLIATNEFNGNEYNQNVSFDLPFSSYEFSWHYNLLNYSNNRYYALITLTNGNKYIMGYPYGLFPTYNVNGESITINLNSISVFDTIIDGYDYNIQDDSSSGGTEGGGSSSGGTEGGGSSSGGTSGDTSQCTDTLSFEFSGSSATFRINETPYTATTSPYTTTLSDLGVDTFTNAKYMFSNNKNITSITSIPCTNNVTDMSSMFYGCSGLTSLDLSSLDTSKVTNMHFMFDSCTNLTSLDVNNWNTSNVRDMGSMFQMCGNLTSLNVNNFNTSQVIDMGYMFYGCESLTSLDLSSFDTSNVTDMYALFYKCTNLTSLNLSNWNMDKVESFVGLFGQCTSLTSITMNNTSCATVDKIKQALENASLTNVTIYSNTNCDGTTSGGTEGGGSSSGDTSQCNDTLSFEFSGDSATFRINETPYTANTSPYVTTLSGLGVDTLNTIRFISYTITSITSIPCTNNVTDMTSMFDGCYRLKSIIFGDNFDTSNVTTMNSMFDDCRGLTTLNLSSFDTSNVTDMYNMFSNCNNLTSLDLTSFDTSNVTTMRHMFYYGIRLTSIDLSSFDTSNVIDMSEMFHNCSGLTSLDLSSFDTSNVTDMSIMFSNCNNLTSLDLSNWNMDKITYMSYIYKMFESCNSLTSIKVTNCNDTTIAKLQQALTDAGYSSTVSNGIITVIH